MARPKLSNMEKKEKLTLSVSHSCKEQMEYIRTYSNTGISAFLEKAVAKEYAKLCRLGRVEQKVMEGQLSIEQIDSNDHSLGDGF